MIIFYIIAGIFTVIMGAGAVCVVCRAGENDKIVNYNNLEE